MAKTMVSIDDTKMSSGGMQMEVDGEMVTLQNAAEGGFKCTVNGKEYKFTDAEIADMLHEQLKAGK